ncbi:hypothetical protein J4E83_008594 [Alternaria metachromatica]|uniref:uncharacterized protein n=1 Tax=Alternaria metachromatica TaxID=283354 RepID=UPI0020C20F9D|nr:uncharacterized protein J4E83_008594 [Alternaria metachromatica]KAI4610029.1 hypothetical protein J4E83_008594 [Alternaria metachromatica]
MPRLTLGQQDDDDLKGSNDQNGDDEASKPFHLAGVFDSSHEQADRDLDRSHSGKENKLGVPAVHVDEFLVALGK